MKLIAAFFCAAALAACSGTAVRIPVAAPSVGDTIKTSIRSLEVRDVSLPDYAAAEEIYIESADGTLSSSSDVLWADVPVRAISLELSRNLAELTGKRIAAEPWPFESFPQARLEVRMDQLLAGADGVFRASGQYFVASFEGGRDRSGFFRLSAPYDPAGGASAIAQARGEVIVQLARLIARDSL